MASTESSFEPDWIDRPPIPEGCFVPIENGTRSQQPDTPPQSVIDIAEATCGRTSATQDINGGVTLGTFRRRFPPELREKIWKGLLPGPRVIELIEMRGIKSYSKPPLALHVCSESRKVALKHYRLAFETQDSPATVYVDFNIDQIYIGLGNMGGDMWGRVFSNMQQHDRESILHLAIDESLATLGDRPGEHEAGHDIDDFDRNQGIHAYESMLKDIRNDDSRLYLSSLQSLTFISLPLLPTNKGHTLFYHYASDIVLSASTSQPTEYHAWQIEANGSVSPWKLPLWKATWEISVSRMWKALEMWEGNGASRLDTVRWVSHKNLLVAKQECWMDRVKFLDERVHHNVDSPGCFYLRTEILDRLIELWEDDYARYHHLGHLLAPYYGELSDAFISPIEAYRAQTKCSCGGPRSQDHYLKAWFDAQDGGEVQIVELMEKFNWENKLDRVIWKDRKLWRWDDCVEDHLEKQGPLIERYSEPEGSDGSMDHAMD